MPNPIGFGNVCQYVAQSMPNSTYTDDRGYSGNAVLWEDKQNAEGIRPHNQ